MARLTDQNRLSLTHPELAAQWHPTRNGSLTPYDVAAGSNKKVWWKCSIADDHVWEARLCNRSSRGVGCPCCANQLVVTSNCIATTHPGLAAQWHPTRNDLLTPYDVVAGSLKRVWWKCFAADDHEWEASAHHRISGGTGCPCCASRIVVSSNCLMTTHPDLAAQWHPTKNGSLTPFDVAAGSAKKVWWKCSAADDHEWEAPLVYRTSGSGCPCCANQMVVLSNCLATTHPELAAQWHSIKNGSLTAWNVTFGSEKRVWWRCLVVDGHAWKASLNSRTSSGCGCPYCKESQGEKAITLVLSQRGYWFDRQVKFDDCKHKRLLTFDFLVWLPNGKRFLVEYQGLQHYEPNSWGSSMTQEDMDIRFEVIQKRDQIKKQYADDNGILLLVIPYWDIQRIESLIEDFIRST